MIQEKYYFLISILEKEIKNFYKDNLITIAIFGSVARGTFRNDSDIDILIIAQNLPKGRMNRIEDFLKIEKKLDSFLLEFKKIGLYPEISPIIKTPEDVLLGSPLFLDMIEEAKILYDKNNFFQNYLNQLKNKLKAIHAKKIYVDSGWYWLIDPKVEL